MCVGVCVCVCARVLYITGKKDSAARAGKVIALVLLTNIRDVGEGEVQHKDLNEARERGGDDLRPKHGPRGDLHVVSEFHVRHEAECLRPGSTKVSVALFPRTFIRFLCSYIVMYPNVLKLWSVSLSDCAVREKWEQYTSSGPAAVPAECIRR